MMPFSQAPHVLPSLTLPQRFISSPIQQHDDDEDDDDDEHGPNGFTLPLQGTHDNAWDYLYEAKGGYLLDQSAAALARQPTYAKQIVVPAKKVRQHKKSASLDFLARLKGESVQEMERRHRRNLS
jgi:hypothetical protein